MKALLDHFLRESQIENLSLCLPGHTIPPSTSHQPCSRFLSYTLNPVIAACLESILPNVSYRRKQYLLDTAVQFHKWTHTSYDSMCETCTSLSQKKFHVRVGQEISSLVVELLASVSYCKRKKQFSLTVQPLMSQLEYSGQSHIQEYLSSTSFCSCFCFPLTWVGREDWYLLGWGEYDQNMYKTTLKELMKR